MRLLEEKIMQEGTVLPGNILKVDAFLNHQIDPVLMNEIGKAFYERFKNEKVTKVLTIETSGIAPAVFTAFQFQVPCVFGKKSVGSNMDGDLYTAEVFSYTHNKTYTISVAKKYIQKDDVILVVDDFMANGLAVQGIKEICDQAGARIAGVGICIEKGFQDGGKKLREQGLRVESLAYIKTMSDNAISFLVQND